MSCPRRALLLQEFAFVEGRVIEDDDGEPARVTVAGEGIEVVDDLGSGTRAAEFTDVKLRGTAEER